MKNKLMCCMRVEDQLARIPLGHFYLQLIPQSFAIDWCAL